MDQERNILNNKCIKTANILFFGAGKLGKYWLDRSINYSGVVPERILDNNRELWGSIYNNVLIESPDYLKSFHYEYIFITCKNKHEIYQQLLELGVEEDKIISEDPDIWKYLRYYSAKVLVPATEKLEETHNVISNKKIIFDLQNGLTLGGVEVWSYDLAKKLNALGYPGIYLTTDFANPIVKDDTYPVQMLQYDGVDEEKDRIRICVQKIVEYLPCTIMCNFPHYTFWSACMVKQLYPNQIRIIAVQHSDDPVYYETYGLWQEFVDQYLVISSRMEQKLILCGVKPGQIGRLEWQICCNENLDKAWNDADRCLQIGYAGRVTTISKRADLLVILAEKLLDRNVDFQLNIAGTGDYSETLQQMIQDKNLQKYIILKGYIDRKEIPAFWNKQGIMVACSELEGHSISQSEAMAEGAVPVITNVSGARDDVTDGYNGYIVDVGDIDTMADRIYDLYHNRKELKQMGQRAHNTIYERQKNADQARFWDDLIKKVWQE